MMILGYSIIGVTMVIMGAVATYPLWKGGNK